MLTTQNTFFCLQRDNHKGMNQEDSTNVLVKFSNLLVGQISEKLVHLLNIFYVFISNSRIKMNKISMLM